jgi:peptidoglycan/LPS O-acetylase OafA/YrhL
MTIPQDNTQEETIRESRLDALRGVAALSVAAGHCVTAFSTKPLYNKTLGELDFGNKTDVILRLFHIIFNADAAVLIFFVLSGYVLFGSLKKTDSNYLAEFGRFTTKRIYRIIPTVAISFLPLVLFLDNFNAFDLVANMLLLKVGINGVTWSLQVEMAAIPVIYLIFLSGRLRYFLILPFLILSLLFFSDYSIKYFKYFPAFYLGYFVGYLRNYRRTLIKMTLPALLGLLLADFLLGYKSNLSIICQIISALVIISAAPYSRIFKILDWKVFLFLGKISFSFYLYHITGALITLWVCGKIGLPLGAMHRVWNVLTYIILSVPIAVLISSVSFFLVEKTSIAAGSKISKAAYSHLLPLDLKITAIFSSLSRINFSRQGLFLRNPELPSIPPQLIQRDMVIEPESTKDKPLV